jgi:hypothetical protein
LQTCRPSGGEERKREAIVDLEHALKYWDEVNRLTRPIYRDIPLTHYNANSREANNDNAFHRARLRGEVAKDVEIPRASRPGHR